ncbi:NBR1-Ig-like domain-containing protein [Janibacter hoylei]|uniref:NBR1-Ig-like domain-containing protein n=1 Tax=Janibacter hoylei TaxID=364298 RepID=UPI0021A40C2D|nr:NBR1-Ig-like domain-containing protein [Janibacter hoylei]MCT1618958.1 NBR1-Ig-like domain-containing protein [Janibacter hoylei]MCT2292597.1 NBR1-Ig-like domain-containing protein [Janibacter hoylei]
MAGATERRAAAIDGFVERLRQVRADAGTPSFREMAKRSGAISHATLHDALQGARMPSWETTVEFARACGTDPQELRAAWERADATVRSTCDEEPWPSADESAAADTPAPEATTEADDPTKGATPDPGEAADDGGSPPSPPARRPVTIALGVAAAAVIVALVTALLTREDADSATSSTTTSGGEAAAAYSSAPHAPSTTTSADGCPENAKVPPGTETLVPGDGAQFAGDVTIADCEVVERGSSVVKTWRFKNTGSVAWTDRSLHRINAHEGDPDCRAPQQVAIGDTPPGGTVEVSVPIAVPDERTVCFTRWMQADADGNFTFPRQRPYFYTFKVR